MASALEGIRVIDLTVWFQGPVAAQHLADFGAEVIKVERPQGGDQARGVRSIKNVPVGEWNQYFLVINRNKKSVALDLKKPTGREIMYRLVEKSDVFLSNMGLDLLESWDLGYDKLSAVNPRLVYATNTGYGRFGQVNRPSFDMTVQALTGLMARLGEPDQPPIYLGMGSGDAYGGLMSALGIILALYHRNRTGKGQMLDASLYGAQLFLTAPTLQAYLATGNDKYAKQQSRKTAENPLWNLYRAKDKWVFLCVPNTDPDWARLCQSLEATEVLNDARFDSADKRRKNTKRLIAQLDKIIKRRKADEWMTRWTAAGITASPVQNLADLAADPQAWANNYFVETYCEEVQRQVKVRGLPIGLSKTPGVVRSLGPELGQDTEMVLTETLGYSWEDVGAFKEQGVIP
ncbi:MAG: acyl-CoA transferase [Deltaproteobacteria bacterium]|nr:acyl-CoA transferase [Deltaproteobacteria bacterium]